MIPLEARVSITGISLANKQIGDSGWRIISFFDVEFFGVEFRGCKLIRTDKDGLTVTPPSLDNQRPPRRGVVFKSDPLRNAIMQEARRAYFALGGTDLPDWARKTENPP